MTNEYPSKDLVQYLTNTIEALKLEKAELSERLENQHDSLTARIEELEGEKEKT